MSHNDIKDILEINTPPRDEFITKQQLFGTKVLLYKLFIISLFF